MLIYKTEKFGEKKHKVATWLLSKILATQFSEFCPTHFILSKNFFETDYSSNSLSWDLCCWKSLSRPKEGIAQLANFVW